MPDLIDDASVMLLGVLCRHAAELLGASSLPPRHIRVHVGDMGIELSWPAGGALAGAPESEGPAAQRQPGARPRPEDGGSQAQGQQIVCAPTVGAFYRCSEPGANPFVDLHDIVEAGQQLGILEAMKLMNPILAEFPGQIIAILAEDGESVEYGQPLFAVAPC